MTEQSSKEAKQQYIEKMGGALGARYHALWQEITLLHFNWNEYVELYGTNEKRIERLNKSAPAFFRMIQDELWSATLLHISRLLDSPKSGGKPNLTLRNLTDLVAEDFKMTIAGLIDKAVDDTKFARDWRNRVIAHRDLSIALEDGAAQPLQEASRADVNRALARLADIMNAVGKYYLDSNTLFNLAPRHNGSLTLLYLLGDGLRRKDECEKRLRQAIEEGTADRAVQRSLQTAV